MLGWQQVPCQAGGCDTDHAEVTCATVAAVLCQAFAVEAAAVSAGHAWVHLKGRVAAASHCLMHTLMKDHEAPCASQEGTPCIQGCASRGPQQSCSQVMCPRSSSDSASACSLLLCGCGCAERLCQTPSQLGVTDTHR